YLALSNAPGKSRSCTLSILLNTIWKLTSACDIASSNSMSAFLMPWRQSRSTNVRRSLIVLEMSSHISEESSADEVDIYILFPPMEIFHDLGHPFCLRTFPIAGHIEQTKLSIMDREGAHGFRTSRFTRSI